MDIISSFNSIILTFTASITPSNLTLLDVLVTSVSFLGLRYVWKLMNYVYHQFRFLFIDDLFEDFTNSDTKPQTNGPYPNGWVPIAERDQLTIGKILRTRVFGQDIVLMRDSDGKVHAVDPYCPHNGAHLGFGEVVNIRGEDCIKCPFHEWSFRAEDGVCVDVPYAKDRKSPKGSDLKKWPCVEVDDFIYIWFHNRGDSPYWFPEPLGDSESRKFRYCRRFEYVIDCDPYIITENTADNYHFTSIHLKNTYIEKMLESFPFCNNTEQAYANFAWTTYEPLECHKAEARSDFMANIRNLEVIRSSFRVVHDGPYKFTTYLDNNFFGISFKMVLVVGITSLYANRQKYALRLYCGNSFLPQLVGRLFLLHFFKNAQGDGRIWKELIRPKKPNYLKEEKEMVKCNRWFTKFYDGADHCPIQNEDSC